MINYLNDVYTFTPYNQLNVCIHNATGCHVYNHFSVTIS